MAFSSAPVAGADITALGIGNIRKDAIIRADTAIAGEAFNATTTTGGITFPTVVYLNGTKWYRFIGDGTINPQTIGLALTGSLGDGSTFSLIEEGSTLTTEFIPGLSGITQGMILFPSGTALGGVATYDGNTMKSYKMLGIGLQSNAFNYQGYQNASNFSNILLSTFTSENAINRYDIVYINSGGRAQKTLASSPFGSGYADAVAVANSATTGSLQPLLCYKVGSVCVVNGGPWTPGLPVYTSDVAGAGSHTKGRFSRQIGVAIDTTQVYLCPLEPNRNMIIEVIVAGDVWSTGDFLYKRSDGQFLRSDADAPESGIAEYPAIALANCGTVGSLQPVALPGSVLHSIIAGTAGTKVWNNSSPGGRSTSHPGLDLFVRKYGHFIDTDRFAFEPDEIGYLPTGTQEKTSVSMAASRSSLSFLATGNSFRKVMSNVPSSIAYSMISQHNVSAGPDQGAGGINRFGFTSTVACSTGTSYVAWYGTAITVGN